MEEIANETMAIIRYIFITACNLSEENDEKDNFL